MLLPLKYKEYGVYGDPIITYPKPYSIYLGGTIGPGVPDPELLLRADAGDSFGFRVKGLLEEEHCLNVASLPVFSGADSTPCPLRSVCVRGPDAGYKNPTNCKLAGPKAS